MTDGVQMTPLEMTLRVIPYGHVLLYCLVLMGEPLRNGPEGWVRMDPHSDPKVGHLKVTYHPTQGQSGRSNEPLGAPFNPAK